MTHWVSIHPLIVALILAPILTPVVIWVAAVWMEAKRDLDSC